MSQPKKTPTSTTQPVQPSSPAASSEPNLKVASESTENTKTRQIDGKTLAGVLEEAKANPPAIKVITGNPLGKYFLIDKEKKLLGRDISADISIPESSISRKHAEFLITENGVYLQDLGSTNGTFINDTRLEANKTYLLNEGDHIKCGNTLFKFVREGQVETEAGKRGLDYTTDSLTGVFNKKAIVDAIQDEFNRSKFRNSPLSFILFDIDFFKKINDTFGHPAGDYVLKATCDHIKSKMIRQRDILGRYGGEEFALLLPQTPSQIAIEVADRIRLAIERYPFVFEEKPIPVTISLGVTSLDSTSKTPDELIALADKALYDAKHSGRNRVCVR